MIRTHLHRSTLVATGLFALAAVAITLMLGLFASVAASAEGSRLTDVRMGRHPTFRRIVMVFDSAPAIARLDRGTSTLELEIQAEGPQERTYFGTADSPIGAVELIRSRWSTSDGRARSGLRFRAVLDGRRARAFALTAPPRLVVDIGPPGEAAFPTPAGTISIYQRTASEPLISSEPEPEPEPEPEARPQPPAPAVVPAPPVVESEPPSPPAPGTVLPVPEITIQPGPTPIEELPGPREERFPQSDDDEVLPDRPAIQQGGAALPAQPGPPAEPAPPSGGQTSIDPDPVPGPERVAGPDPIAVGPPNPGVAKAPTSEPQPGAMLRRLLWVCGAIVAATALWLIVSRSFRSSIDADSGISAALELETASRLDALEKRMDEEARSRVAMEERLLHLHEELKVMRDRLTRRVRRPE